MNINAPPSSRITRHVSRFTYHVSRITPASAFTLIELLVVIAIIAILAALLFPVLSQSKARALQIQCLGQNRQIALALQMYAQENNDVLPWPNWGTRFQGWLYTPTNGGPPEPSDPPQ